MASASKTPNLNLPQWVGTEKPERTDFNAAFDAIDGLNKDVCKMNLTSNQTISNTTLTEVAFNNTEIDTTGTMADTINHRLYARKAGVYIVCGNILFENPSTTTGVRIVYLAVNGASVTPNGMNYLQNHLAGYNATPFITAVSLAEDDYITILVYQSAGKNMTIVSGKHRTDVSLIQAG